MNYSIPTSAEELIALRQKPVNEELIVAAIAGVVRIARSQNQSLAQLQAEVLADHNLLDDAQRQWLSDLVTETWQALC